MHKQNRCDTLILIEYNNKGIKQGGIELKNGIKTLAIWLVIGVIILFVVPAVLDGTNKQMTYSELLSKIEAGEVTDISISYDGDSAKVKLKDDNSIKNVNLPGINNLLDNLNEFNERKQCKCI